MASPKGVDWDLVDLGRRPDAVIAREHGVSPETVNQVRHRRGISVYRPESRWDGVDLGKRSDYVIAAEQGVGVTAVFGARQRRGIPAWQPQDAIRADSFWDGANLGKRPDSAIAAELGVNRERVGKQRRKRGIPAFVGFVLRQDGTPCRSVYEAMYDAVLHHHGAEHEHEVPFPSLGIVADLVVDGRVIEIAGMVGYTPYDRRKKRKEEIYAAAGIDVTWLSIAEVKVAYTLVPLRFQTRPRACSDCGKDATKFVGGRCQTCALREWDRRNAIEQRTCEQCGGAFMVGPRTRANPGRFCSHRCYGDSLARYPWPTWDELNQRLEAAPSVAAVARDLNVTYTALYQRLRRHQAA